jgi:hypothetical protein
VYSTPVIFISVTVATAVEPVFVATITIEGVLYAIFTVRATPIFRVAHIVGGVFGATATPHSMIVGTTLTPTIAVNVVPVVIRYASAFAPIAHHNAIFAYYVSAIGWV